MEEFFSELGFNQSQADVFLSLAQLGKASPTLLAKKLGIPRSTTYSILQTLIARGLVYIEQDREGTYYLPNPPESLVSLVEAEKKSLNTAIDKKTEAAKQLLKLVSPFFTNQNYSVPKIQFYEGSKNVETMLYAQEKIWQDSISKYDCIWWGYQDVHFVENYRKWLDHYWSQMLPHERIKLLSNKSQVEKKLKDKVSNRQIKQLPKGKEFSSTIWVLGEYVILIMTRQEPQYAFQLKDSVFAANQRNIFQMLWEMIK